MAQKPSTKDAQEQNNYVDSSYIDDENNTDFEMVDYTDLDMDGKPGVSGDITEGQKWRNEFGEILNAVKDQVLGCTKMLDQNDPEGKKIKLLREKKPLLPKDGASRVMSFLVTRIHKGINFSIYTDEQINTRLKNIRGDLRDTFWDNYTEWIFMNGLPDSNLHVVADLAMDNIEAIFRRAKDGKELDYTYDKNSFDVQANISQSDSGNMPAQNKAPWYKPWAKT